jgi:hypothetical protein
MGRNVGRGLGLSVVDAAKIMPHFMRQHRKIIRPLHHRIVIRVAATIQGIGQAGVVTRARHVNHSLVGPVKHAFIPRILSHRIGEVTRVHAFYMAQIIGHVAGCGVRDDRHRGKIIPTHGNTAVFQRKIRRGDTRDNGATQNSRVSAIRGQRCSVVEKEHIHVIDRRAGSGLSNEGGGGDRCRCRNRRSCGMRPIGN